MLPRSEREPIDNTADEASRALLAPPFAAPREPREPRALLATPLVFVVVWVRASAEEGAFDMTADDCSKAFITLERLKVGGSSRR